MEFTPSQWLRAAVITSMLVVHGLFAVPLPQRVTPADLSDPEAAEEVARWAILLGVQPDWLGHTVVQVTAQIRDGSKAVRKPFRPMMRLFGWGQSWAMFASPDTWPDRLEIHLRVQGQWVLLYRRWDADHWMRGVLRYRRVRGIYDAANERSVPYWNVSRWIAKRALLDHPEADAVRVRAMQLHTTLPGQEPDPYEKPHLVRVHKRSSLFPDDDLAP